MSAGPGLQTEVVIAHYNEDLSWLVPIASSATIYTKSGNILPISKTRYSAKTQTLPNIGREGHTYLHHIVERYDHLPPVTCFLQGRVDDHVAFDAPEILHRASLTKPGKVTTFSWRELELFDHWNGIPWEEYPCWSKWSSMPVVNSNKTPGDYFTELLGYDHVPAAIGFAPGALFAVHRDTIRRRPLSFYQKLRFEFFLGPMADINPITGHYMERFWLAMFNPEEYICWQYQTDTAIQERNEQGQLARGRWHITPKYTDLDPKTLSPMSGSGMVSPRGSATPPSIVTEDETSTKGGSSVESDEL